jgi:hypothetical protein
VEQQMDFWSPTALEAGLCGRWGAAAAVAAFFATRLPKVAAKSQPCFTSKVAPEVAGFLESFFIDARAASL